MEANNKPTPFETLNGGLTITITKRDGTTEEVKVRQLFIEHLDAFLKAAEDEPAYIELLCDKPKGWALTLSNESYEQIVSEGDRLNTSFMARSVERKLARAERIMPGTRERLMKALPTPPVSLSVLPSDAASPSSKPGGTP